MEYWEQRILDSQNRLTDKSIAQTEKQLKKQYKASLNRTLKSFESTYNKILATAASGKAITPADIYKLNKYWEMQGELKNELQKLGDKEVNLLTKKFIEQYQNVYDAIKLPISTTGGFNAISQANAQQALNSVWCADGKNWSQRVWENTSKLAEELTDQLVTSAITGASTSQLKKELIEKFNVSYNRADTLVRTEMAHLQTEAAMQRYKDYGIKSYQFCADTDTKTCDQCAELDGKIFLISEKQAGVNYPPIHPNDRCCIIPVVE